MKKILFLLILIASKGYSQNKYWQQQTDFSINVSLNDTAHVLNGYEKIKYYNNSPDTLRFIWIHLWPNAYKNDRTAFAEQELINGSTNFYFSKEKDRGYINQLNFKVDGINALTEDHPLHQDIVKLNLPKPLLPNTNTLIETPFRVKLPFTFSRSGHIEQNYQITQWYPKPAVYDKDGWHPMPYLDQGEFYAEFGNYDVKITIPENYVVAATGDLQDESEKIFLKSKERYTNFKKPTKIISSTTTKTIQYIQNNVHDFAWFADKYFVVKSDTALIEENKIVQVFSYILPENLSLWENSITYAKRSLQSKSKWIGNYPYNTVSLVDTRTPYEGGMEYPTITAIKGGLESDMEILINHEIGHNWFYGILATNERDNPWMDEGMNTYYDKRYYKTYLEKPKVKETFFTRRMPEDFEELFLKTTIALKIDQPINTNAEKFTEENYNLIAYEKAAQWLVLLEKEVGINNFEKLMRQYYETWKFKHPTKEDFKLLAENISGKDLNILFAKLEQKGNLVENNSKKKIKFGTLFNLKEAEKYNYINIAPALGINYYDKLMIGATIHNYSLPLNKFNFMVSPMYSTTTKKLNGVAKFTYSHFVGKQNNKLSIDLAGSKFTGASFKDATGKQNPLQFYKIVPSIKLNFAPKNALSSITKSLQFKTFLITETNLNFTRDAFGVEKITYPKTNRYLNQLQFSVENNRALYPYNTKLQAEQGDGFMRLNFTANQFFNYQNGGGMQVRIFAGKFIYLQEKNFINAYKTDIYHLNLTGPRGFEDYTYSNYFAGRNNFEGFASQQLMNRDGFFKVGTDLLSNKVGKSDNWLFAANFSTTIPDNVNVLNALPIKIPIKVFVDMGTYAEAWKTNAPTSKFLFDAGFQLSLFKNILNIYIPVVYSKVYKDYFKSTITEKKFQKSISFNLDINKIRLSTFLPQLNF